MANYFNLMSFNCMPSITDRGEKSQISYTEKFVNVIFQWKVLHLLFITKQQSIPLRIFYYIVTYNNVATQNINFVKTMLKDGEQSLSLLI